MRNCYTLAYIAHTTNTCTHTQSHTYSGVETPI